MQSLPTAEGKDPSAGFDQLYEEMSSWHGWSSPKVRENVLGSARNLFRWLRERGHESMSTVRLDDVRDHYMQRAKEITYLISLRYTLKLVFSYMTATERIGFDSSSVFRLKVPRRNRLLPAMDADAIARVLDAIDRSSCIGKRDYAFILLGAATGLRESDIAALRLKDVDWRKGAISIVQRKTSRAISVPLLRGVGDALQDYILNGRGEPEVDRVFVTSAGGRPLTPGLLTRMFLQRCRRAGVARMPHDGLSFHSLRRSVGKRLCTAGVPLESIAQCLGHGSVRSAERYICLAGESLAECALGFDVVGNGGALWN